MARPLDDGDRMKRLLNMPPQPRGTGAESGADRLRRDHPSPAFQAT